MQSRRLFCAGAAASTFAAPAFADEPPQDVTFIQDFDELWETLRDRYCFFFDKCTDWDRVRRMYRPLAVSAQSGDDFTEMVRRVLCELYDAHTHLADAPDGTPRFPLFDLLAERRDGGVRIAAVQDESAASDAGLRIGDTVLSVDGQPIESIITDRMPKCLTRPDPEADAYVINSAVAGRRAMPRQMTLRGVDGAPREVALPLKQRAQTPDLDSRALDGGLGYIRIRSFGDTATIGAFDTALASLRETQGLIIDVRDNGGGDTAVARPIMGRFITETKPYATMRRRDGRGLSAPWTETVEPRGPFTYTQPVVVLCNHWSGSMAEGFPMGMRGIGRARIVGTRMMGLGAAVFSITLDRTGTRAQYSGEPVYDITGAPRWQLRPDVETPSAADILQAGVRELRRLLAG